MNICEVWGEIGIGCIYFICKVYVCVSYLCEYVYIWINIYSIPFPWRYFHLSLCQFLCSPIYNDIYVYKGYRCIVLKYQCFLSSAWYTKKTSQYMWYLFLKWCICLLGQHWFRQWLLAFLASGYYHNQMLIYWDKTIQKNAQLKFSQNLNIFIQENALKVIIVCDVFPILV